MRKYLLLSLSTFAFSSAAAAQDVPIDTNQSSTSSDGSVNWQTNSGAVQEEMGGISDIVVTASRRAENAQRAALSIQALSGEALSRANVTKPEDLSSVAVGVQIGTAGPYPQAYIRGVGNYSTQVFAESAVAFNLDGVYVSRTWATRGFFYDLDRVEVLKGPQGTLYGRNASGGAINVISAKPKLGVLGGFAELTAGNYDLLQGTAAINLPLSTNLAVRAATQVTRRDGYLSDGYDNDRTQAGRLQLYWEPAGNLTFLLTGNYQHIGGNGAGPSPMPPLAGEKFLGATDPRSIAIVRAQPGLGPLLTVPQTDGFVDASIYAVSGELNWDFGSATLTVLPAYRFAKLEMRHYLPGFLVENAENDKQTSLEIRFSHQSERLKWVLGGFFFDEEQGNLPGQSVLFVNQGINVQNSIDLSLRTRSYAAFGQATFSISDTFRFTGGLRYTYERKKYQEREINYGLPNQNPPPACNAGVFDPFTPYPPLFCRVNLSTDEQDVFKSVTYKAGFEFDVGPRSLAYGNVSTGFKSGGFFTAPPPNTFKPEKLTSFDLGLKNRFFDNTLQVNFEIFYWRYKDHQESYTGPTSIPGFFTFLTTNAGRATSYGGDLDVVYRPSSSDQLSLKVQYNKTKYNSFQFDYLSAAFGAPTTGCSVGPQVDGFQRINCSGKSLVRAPLWTGTIGYAHTFDLGTSGSLIAGADAQFASKSNLSIDFLRSGQQRSYIIGNLDLTYKSANELYSLSIFINNVANQAVFNQAFRNLFVSGANNPLSGPDGQFLGTLRPPRTYGVRARVNF